MVVSRTLSFGMGNFFESFWKDLKVVKNLIFWPPLKGNASSYSKLDKWPRKLKEYSNKL